MESTDTTVRIGHNRFAAAAQILTGLGFLLANAVPYVSGDANSANAIGLLTGLLILILGIVVMPMTFLVIDQESIMIRRWGLVPIYFSRHSSVLTIGERVEIRDHGRRVALSAGRFSKEELACLHEMVEKMG